MHIKAIVSATALTVALGFGTAAFAQTMIGDQTVSEGDMERVKVYCEDLQNAENQAAGATAAEEELTEADDGSSADDTADATDDGDDDSAAVGSIDMDIITLENCIEAGFVTAP
jgi:hypothetical protein